MSYTVYPNAIDTSTQLPITTDLVTLVAAQVVNRLRDSVLAIETELGVNPSAIYSTVKNRLDALTIAVSFTPQATIPCDASVSVDDFIYLDGYTAISANASDITTSPAIGHVNSKESATLANIDFFGLIILSGLTAGSEYFLSTTSGEITTVAPSSSGNVIQSLGIAISDTKLLFLPNLEYTII